MSKKGGEIVKSIGVVRRLDMLGRIVLPKDLRRTMSIGSNAPMEILVHEDSIILKKYEPECVFCGNAENVQDFRGKKVCSDCARDLYNHLALEQ
jgi:transcriptional pleiotropic regulator of transition state genes